MEISIEFELSIYYLTKMAYQATTWYIANILDALIVDYYKYGKEKFLNLSKMKFIVSLANNTKSTSPTTYPNPIEIYFYSKINIYMYPLMNGINNAYKKPNHSIYLLMM